MNALLLILYWIPISIPPSTECNSAMHRTLLYQPHVCLCILFAILVRTAMLGQCTLVPVVAADIHSYLVIYTAANCRLVRLGLPLTFTTPNWSGQCMLPILQSIIESKTGWATVIVRLATGHLPVPGQLGIERAPKRTQRNHKSNKKHQNLAIFLNSVHVTKPYY